MITGLTGERGEALNPTVSIVIPAFNEEATIGNTITRTLTTLEATRLPYEVIVVDDGSTDQTRTRAQHRSVTLLTNGKNQGKGSALKRGFTHATGAIVITIDADGSHDPADIKKLLTPALNGADVVIGSRFANGQGNHATKKLHLIGNHLINLVIRVLTGKHITDSQTGFRALKREVIQEIRIASQGYQVETELTVKSLKNGNHVQEVPIRISPRADGASHLCPLRDGLKIFKTIMESSINP
jgi:glycosyltransferase involved in cell wall biosynthesis